MTADDQEIQREERRPFIGKTLRVFISYANSDKKIAGAIKEAFNHYGMEAFLAHEDLHVGEEWRNRILRELKQSDVFLALLSSNFMTSVWTNQESGFAICKETPIVPVSMDGTMPKGILEMYQALTNFECTEIKYTSGETGLDCKESVFRVIQHLTTRDELKDNLRDSLISNLSELWKFDDAKKHFMLLTQLEPFNREQINEIIRKSAENHNVYQCCTCKPILRDILEKYTSLVDPVKKEELLGLINKS